MHTNNTFFPIPKWLETSDLVYWEGLFSGCKNWSHFCLLGEIHPADQSDLKSWVINEVVLFVLKRREEEKKGREKEKARRKKGIWLILFKTSNMNPCVERPPLHLTVKEFNDTLITSLTFRRWKSGKLYCVLLFLDLKISIFWKGKPAQEVLPSPRICGVPAACVHWHHWDTSISKEFPVTAPKAATARNSRSPLSHSVRTDLSTNCSVCQTSLCSLKPLRNCESFSHTHGFLGKHPQLTTAASWAAALP